MLGVGIINNYIRPKVESGVRQGGTNRVRAKSVQFGSAKVHSFGWSEPISIIYRAKSRISSFSHYSSPEYLVPVPPRRACAISEESRRRRITHWKRGTNSQFPSLRTRYSGLIISDISLYSNTITTAASPGFSIICQVGTPNAWHRCRFVGPV